MLRKPSSLDVRDARTPLKSAEMIHSIRRAVVCHLGVDCRGRSYGIIEAEVSGPGQREEFFFLLKKVGTIIGPPPIRGDNVSIGGLIPPTRGYSRYEAVGIRVVRVVGNSLKKQLHVVQEEDEDVDIMNKAEAEINSTPLQIGFKRYKKAHVIGDENDFRYCSINPAIDWVSADERLHSGIIAGGMDDESFHVQAMQRNRQFGRVFGVGTDAAIFLDERRGAISQELVSTGYIDLSRYSSRWEGSMLHANRVVGLESEMDLKRLQHKMHCLENMLREIRGEDTIEHTCNYEAVMMDTNDDDYKSECDVINQRCSILTTTIRQTLLSRVRKLENEIRQVKCGRLWDDASDVSTVNACVYEGNGKSLRECSVMNDRDNEYDGENVWLLYLCSTLQDDLEDLLANMGGKADTSMDSDDESLFSDSD